MEKSLEEQKQIGISLEEYKKQSFEYSEDFCCTICQNMLQESTELSCGHTFCFSCISKWHNTIHTRNVDNNWNKPIPCPDCKTSFKEEDIPNFFGSSYSIIKGFTDRLMHQLDNYVLNLRIRMPISSENAPRNFITKITKYEKICNIPNSMTLL